ncbi:MAG: PLP-dependent aminotransferase family protein [Defluviitaleaceae bacterium]|nr:PLP-dependent aminotransferase family protein [Defluviitaleaceae bacterium]
MIPAIPVLDKTSATPLYKQLGDALIKKISVGEILPHEKLPPIRVLAASLCVNNATVVSAYKYLEKNGAIYSVLGSGTFAAKIESASDTRRLDFAESKISADCINFLSLAPDPKLFPEDDFRRCFDEILAREGANAFSFPGVQGYAPLRDIVCELFYQNISCDFSPKNIQITQSANEGLEMLADALISPGDTVIIETPSRPEAASIFASRGAKILEVALNESGLDLEKFTFFVKKFKPKIFFLSPNYQIPTTLCYTQGEKMRVLDLAYNSNAYIIEDDLQGDFFYGEKPTSLLSMDERGRVIGLKSFDRVLTPGIMGFLACPDEIINRIRGLGGASGYIQRGLGFYLKNCDFNAHLEHLRKVYGRKYHKTVSAARQFLGPMLEPDSFKEPGGGLGLWLRARGDASGFADELLARKVLIAPDELFSGFSRNQPYFRINFANVTEDEISRGIGIIASVLKER